MRKTSIGMKTPMAAVVALCLGLSCMATAGGSASGTSVQAANADEPGAPAVSLANRMEASLGRIQGKEAQVAYLPAMQLRWAVRSKATATGGVFRKHKSSKEIIAPFDQALLQRVLVALQDDLATRFEAAGWHAVTAGELGADLPQMKTLKPNAELGVPLFKYDDTINAHDYVVIALPGAAPMDAKAISNGMAIQRFLKGKQGLNANIVYTFAPGTVGETDSRMLGTEAGAGLWFSARADLNGAERGGWGNINTKPEGLVVAPDIGTLAEIAGSKAGTAENVIRFIGGMGGVDRTGYQMTPDWAKAEAAMISAGKAFNAELVARLK